MPLLGHAFTGMATALIVASKSQQNAASQTFPKPFITTSLVTLSYLPDIVSQCALFFNWYDGRQFGHSVLFALLAAPIAGFILSHQTFLTKKQCFLLALSTILLHDLLDILQSTDRLPFWPFYTTTIGNNINIIPANPSKEGLLFGVLYGLVLTRYLWRGRKKYLGEAENRQPARTSLRKRGEKIFIMLIMLMALTTYHLRIQRIHTFQQAKEMFHQQHYSNSLALFNEADRWPRIAKPGRLDYFKGIIYLQQHRPALAEKYLLRSYSRNNGFFWCIGDLALFYAKSSKAISRRTTLAEPFIRKMHRDFSEHPDYPEYMQKIRRALAPGQ